MTDNSDIAPTDPTAMERSPSGESNTSLPCNSHLLWSEYMNGERSNIVQEHPQLDRKILGGFISNVLMRIAQDKTSQAQERDPDDEWHTALLGELSALRDYYPPGFRIFAEFVSRILRRASNNGQASALPYRPASASSSSRRGSSVFSDPRSGSPPASWLHEQRLPPISSLPQARAASPDLTRHYPAAPVSPPKSTSPPSIAEEYHPHYAASAAPASCAYYARSGTDPHLFSLESSGSFLTRPVPTRPVSLPQKRPAEEYPPVQPRQYVAQREEEKSVAAMLSEANALSAKLGNMAANGERASSQVEATGEGRTLACLRCRRKKTRCNHARPTCSRCAHSGFKCEYPDPLPKPTDMASSIAKLQGQLQLLNSRMQAGERME